MDVELEAPDVNLTYSCGRPLNDPRGNLPVRDGVRKTLGGKCRRQIAVRPVIRAPLRLAAAFSLAVTEDPNSTVFEHHVRPTGTAGDGPCGD